MNLPEFYTEHLNLQGAHYDPEEGDIVVVAEVRVPAPEALGVPAAELIDAVADFDDDGTIDKAEMLDGAMRALNLGAAFASKKS